MKFCKNPVSAGFFILNALLSFGFLSGCHWRSDVGNKPVLQVNEHKITAKEFADRLARQLKDFDALSAKDANIVKRAKKYLSPMKTWKKILTTSGPHILTIFHFDECWLKTIFPYNHGKNSVA